MTSATRFGPDNPFDRFERSELDQSIPSRFDAMVERHGVRTAVEWRDQSLTYRELAGRARALALAIAAEPAPTPYMALLLEDRLLQVTAILATLAAGRAFVPFDPADPPERSRELYGLIGATLLVTEDSTAAAARRLGPCVAADAGSADGSLGGGDIDPDAPAYIMTTSGSTGRPRGVLQTHRSVLHNVMKLVNSLHLGPADRVTMLGAYTFAASMSDLAGTLLSGATLLPYDLLRDGLAGLPAWFESRQPTVAFFVPTTFRRAAPLLAGRAENLRLLKLAGETVTAADIELARRTFGPATVLLNSLGATEINTIRQFFVPPGWSPASETIPVGYAVDDTEVRIFDEAGALVPVGVAGRIVIRSPFLSPGSVDDDAAAHATFGIDPDGTPVLFTSDCGRLDADGCLEHLGRLDDALKIRGRTVFPLEVEGAIMATGQVTEAAVIADIDGSGEAGLAAVIVPTSGALDLRELRRALADRLPQGLVPGRIEVVTALPLLASGKVDRRALPGVLDAAEAFRRAQRTSEARHPPRDELETFLLKAWTSALHRRSLGVDDDFFALGGTSLEAAVLMDLVERTTGTKLPPTLLFEAPTVALLAARIRAGPQSGSPPTVLSLAGGEGLPVFCFHPPDGTVFCYLTLARQLSPAHPVLGIQARGVDGRELPDEDVPTMARRYAEEVRAVVGQGPVCLLGLSGGGVLAYETARLLAAQAVTVQLLVLVDTLFPGAASGQAWRLRMRARRAALALRYLGPRASHHLQALRAGATARDRAGYAADKLRHAGRLLVVGPPRPGLRAAMRRALSRYRPGPYDGPVLAFRARTLAVADAEGRPVDAWRSVAPADFRVVKIAGRHAELLEEPHVRSVSDTLRASLVGTDRPRSGEIDGGAEKGD